MHIVVKVIFIRSDARVFKRIYPQRDFEAFYPVDLTEECVNIRGVSRRIENDERRVLMAGGTALRCR